jgi:hypothetical protein
METIFIVLGVIALGGFCVWLFGFEPRRKIYDEKINAPPAASPDETHRRLKRL